MEMKSTILLLAFAALVSAGTSDRKLETPVQAQDVQIVETKEPTVIFEDPELSRNTRASMVVGQILPGDRMLTMQTVYKMAMQNIVQTEQVVFNGAATTRISAILAREIGQSQNARAVVYNGGLGYNFVSVMFTSAVGRGYRYQFEVWGR